MKIMVKIVKIFIGLSVFILAGCSSFQNDWLNDYWPHHTASGGQNATLQNSGAPPKQIALLLPLSGSMASPGRAVQKGFMASYEEALASGDISPDVMVKTYDTSQGDVLTLYKRAVNEGADFVVGPLEKEKVQRIANAPVLVPTLALNDVNHAPQSGLYFFGLSPLDEAKQAAEHAASQGHHSAIIIAPAGSWGTGVVAAFKETWQQHDGRVVAQFRYSPSQDMGPYIRGLLLVNDSQTYRERMEKLLNRPLKSEEYRRQDADMIFLVAQPQKARQINPLLKFYYAGDLPVYSISTLYNGVPSPLLDQDLNGIQFDDVPWIFDSSATQLSSFPRLYALGMDAMMLVYRRSQWNNSPSYVINGKTGQLHWNASNRISRELIWAEFQNGEVRQID